MPRRTRGHFSLPLPTRREALYGLGATLGTVALNAMVARDASASPLAARSGHHRPRAKRCIFLFMEGGPSHIDTFDPKPKLSKLHGERFQRQGENLSAMAGGERYFVESPYGFRRVGQAGMWMSDPWQHLPGVADDLCLYRGCVAESVNHPSACYHMNTGRRFPGDPALGAWVSYGLGTVNDNLPSFVVLPEQTYPQGGTANWSNGFLPAHFQGTTLRATGEPIVNLEPPDHVCRQTQRQNLDLLNTLNDGHRQRHPQHEELAARMDAYELAFRMQAEVPGVVDVDGESETTKALYGLDEPETEDFGRRCLMARRLVEHGVRFVQLYSIGWDSHDYIKRSHRQRIRAVDKPIAGLIADLKQRGMLDDTLVIWCGEFGRTPDNGMRGGGVAYGRDHNITGMSILFAGGGTPRGTVVGETDEIGEKAVDVVHPLRDLHVTILNLLGLSDDRLRYFHEGRYKQLSQVGGSVIRELIA